MQRDLFANEMLAHKVIYEYGKSFLLVGIVERTAVQGSLQSQHMRNGLHCTPRLHRRGVPRVAKDEALITHTWILRASMVLSQRRAWFTMSTYEGIREALPLSDTAAASASL